MVQMWNEILEQPLVLERCHSNNRQVIKEIVKKINEKNVDSVMIAARGTSDHAGVYGKYLLEYAVGIPVALAAPSIVTVYRRNLKLRNKLVIGISQSGKAADVLEVIREANKQGAITVSITNFNDSPLALESNYHLYTDAGIEKSVAATKTFTAQMFLLALLISEWAEDQGMKDELAAIAQNISRSFDVSQLIERKVERYRYMNECFVLSRGINYAIALEAALKIQETTYVQAKAFSTSDFYHGPLAMIEKGTPVVIFAPEGPCFNTIKEMADKLKHSQAELVIVSNNAKILELGNTGFQIPPTTNDMVSPFYNVVVAQMFACQLALVKGLDPDAPRGLNKVTITK